MSGGRFDYNQYRIRQIWEDIQEELDKQGKEKPKDDLRYYDKEYFEFAKEAFISAVESKGFYWLKNPIDEPNKYVQKCMSFENLSNQFKLFDEKEEKTFRNPLIFVKK